MPIVQVICTKVRDGAKRIVRLKEGEPRGKHVVIVDDLVQSGGTLIECQKLLAAQVGLAACLRTLSLACITPASASHPETTFLHHSSIVPTVLTPQGAASVSAYVTHGVFPNATYERFSPQGDGSSADGFKYFWITDSCANTAHALRDRPPFEVNACSSALHSHHYAATLCSAALSTET